MGLALAPQCCCGGPGIVRGFDWSAYLFTNHQYDWVAIPGGGGWYPQLKRWPCWATRADYEFATTAYNGIAPAKPPTLYDAAHGYWIEGSLGYLPKTNELVKGTTLTAFGVTHGADDAKPAVAAGRCDDCVYLGGFPTTAYPGGNLKARTLLTVGQAIDAYLALGLPVEGNAAFVGADETNIFCRVKWTTYSGADRTDHFRVFTIAHGGGAPTTLYQVDEAFGANWNPPDGMNVQDGQTYFSRNGDASVKFYKNNNQFAEMTGGSGPGWAIAEVAGQKLALGPPVAPDFGGQLCIVEDGADVATNAVRFATIDDLGPAELIPLSIGYDYQRRAVVIAWGYPAGGFGQLQFALYSTYHNEPLEPGNILGQHGVTAYELFPAGAMPEDQFFGDSGFGGTHGHGGFGLSGAQSYRWHHVLSGRMPTPLVIEAGHIVNPPQPPPPPDCSGLTECASLPPLSLTLRELDNFDMPTAFSPFDGKYRWLLKNLEQSGYLLPFIGNYQFRIDLVTPNNYAAPGILIQQWEDVDPDYRLEHYVYAIELAIACVDGAVAFYYINFWLQEFLTLTGDSELTPSANNILWQVVNPVHSLAGRALTCATTPFRSEFSYDDPLHNVNNDGPRFFSANGIIGAIE